MLLLEVTGLSVSFGGLSALNEVSIQMESDEIRGLIGPNGAGKTTFFNTISGLQKPSAGEISFEGNSLNSRKPHQINRAGLARTYQNIRLFGAMTALENVMVGLDSRAHSGVVDAIFAMPKQRRLENDTVERAYALLNQVGIGKAANEQTRTLSYGDQRRVEIARALGTTPKLLMLDEPTAGMNPSEKLALIELIRSIHQRGIAILLIEHDMKVVMGISENISVLDFGVKIAEGTPSEVQSNPAVIDAYLGTGSSG